MSKEDLESHKRKSSHLSHVGHSNIYAVTQNTLAIPSPINLKPHQWQGIAAIDGSNTNMYHSPESRQVNYFAGFSHSETINSWLHQTIDSTKRSGNFSKVFKQNDDSQKATKNSIVARSQKSDSKGMKWASQIKNYDEVALICTINAIEVIAQYQKEQWTNFLFQNNSLIGNGIEQHQTHPTPQVQSQKLTSTATQSTWLRWRVCHGLPHGKKSAHSSRILKSSMVSMAFSSYWKATMAQAAVHLYKLKISKIFNRHLSAIWKAWMAVPLMVNICHFVRIRKF